MENITSFGKLISDPTRVKIIRLLATKPLCVCELMEILRVNQSCVSQHLSILKYHRLLKSRRDGKWIVYEIDRKVLKGLLRETERFLTASLAKVITLSKEHKKLLTLKNRGLLCQKLKCNRKDVILSRRRRI